MDKAIIGEEKIKQIIVIESVVDEAIIKEEKIKQKIVVGEVVDQNIKTGVNL